MSDKVQVSIEQLKEITARMLSRLEDLKQDLVAVAGPYDEQANRLLSRVNELEERRSYLESFIKEKAIEYQIDTVAGRELTLQVKVSEEIDRDWLKEYYSGNPMSILKAYVTIKPSVAFSPRGRQERVPFSTLVGKVGHNQAVETARRLVEEKYVAIDTETTGLFAIDQVVSIAITGTDSHFYSLVRPTVPISPEATALHHITEEMVAAAPTLADVMPTVRVLCQGKKLTAFNAPFDRKKIEVSAAIWGTKPLEGDWTCSMRLYKQYADVSKATLEEACQAMGLDLGGPSHHAANDSQLAYRLVEQMAKGELFPVDIPDWNTNLHSEEQQRYARQRIIEIQAEISSLRLEIEEAKRIVSNDVKRIEDEKKAAMQERQAEFDRLLSRAKQNVEAIGQTIQGQHYQLVYSQRHYWDSEGIRQYIQLHPESEFAHLALQNMHEERKVSIIKTYAGA